MSEHRQLRSQRLRQVKFQGDALRLGMNWTVEDLGKPQVLMDSGYGMGHTGTFHFRPLIEEVSNGVFEAGGKPGVFTVSDICDGIAQAHSGMSYSLVSRDIMAAMVEIHALGHPHDGMVLISGNDKSVPAHLLAIARCNLPAIHLPGGTQLNGPDYVTSDQMWGLGSQLKRGERTLEDLEAAQAVACPTCGACQFMGSASTGQVFAEALGLALLHLDCLTITGKTLGENLAQIERSGFFAETRGYLNNVHVPREEVLRPRSDPFGPEGGVAVLRGNLAPRGAVVKYFSVPREMHVHVGQARVFDSEDSAVEALLSGQVEPGDVVVIRYGGPRANGMPEMYFATAIVAADPRLSHTTAVVTDGRYSGAAKGPAVGHVTPEALDGGPIALVENGDLIEIHIPERRLDLVGGRGRRLGGHQMTGG